MATLKDILGYNTKEKSFDTFGTHYLMNTNNPGAMIAVNAILVVRDDNKTFTAKECKEVMEFVELKVKENDSKSKN